jgi:hypothetical protein
MTKIDSGPVNILLVEHNPSDTRPIREMLAEEGERTIRVFSVTLSFTEVPAGVCSHAVPTTSKLI